MYRKPRGPLNVNPFVVEAVSVEILSTLPGGKLTQESRLNFKAMDEYFFKGMAVFAIVDNDWTPLELYYLMKVMNGLYMLNKDDPKVYENLCQEYDPRVIRGFRLKACGGPWLRYSPGM